MSSGPRVQYPGVHENQTSMDAKNYGRIFRIRHGLVDVLPLEFPSPPLRRRESSPAAHGSCLSRYGHYNGLFQLIKIHPC